MKGSEMKKTDYRKVMVDGKARYAVKHVLALDNYEAKAGELVREINAAVGQFIEEPNVVHNDQASDWYEGAPLELHGERWATDAEIDSIKGAIAKEREKNKAAAEKKLKAEHADYLRLHKKFGNEA